VVCDMLHGFDCVAVVAGPAAGRMAGIAAAMDFILGLDDGEKRYLQASTELSKAFALSVPHEAAPAIRSEVGLFRAVRAGLVKLGGGGGGGGGGEDEPPEDLDTAIRQIVSKAVASDRVLDLSAPTAADMAVILDAIDESLDAGKPAYVHCWGGVGRTGTVVGCWLLRHRLAEPSGVLEVLMPLRGHDRERRHRMSPETGEQQRFMRQWPEWDGTRLHRVERSRG